MKRRRSVALLIETSNAYARGLLEGVIGYMQSHDSWSIYLPEQQRTARPPAWLGRWRGDGIIARIETEEAAELVSRKNLPTVDVSAARHIPNIPWVETDDAEISRLAADHLLERGFRNLAFVGDPGFNWSLWREQHFERIVQEQGCRYDCHRSISRLDARYSWNTEYRQLSKWLDRLPKPVGIMACYDIKAQQVLDVCRELDLAVPEQVAVIGADNDQLLCNLSDPPLSSVIPNSQRAGYEAARLLDQMMSGQKVDKDAVLVRPLGIETRQSTDTLAIDDADIAEAASFHSTSRQLRDQCRRCAQGSPPVAPGSGKQVPQDPRPHATRRDRPATHRPRPAVAERDRPLASRDRKPDRIRAHRVLERGVQTSHRPITKSVSSPDERDGLEITLVARLFLFPAASLRLLGTGLLGSGLLV